MKILAQIVVGIAFVCAGLFLLRRRRVLYSKNDVETGGYRDQPFDFPNHVKMLVFGLTLMG